MFALVLGFGFASATVPVVVPCPFTAGAEFEYTRRSGRPGDWVELEPLHLRVDRVDATGTQVVLLVDPLRQQMATASGYPLVLPEVRIDWSSGEIHVTNLGAILAYEEAARLRVGRSANSASRTRGLRGNLHTVGRR